MTAGAVPASAKAVHGHKANAIHCPICDEGHDLDCLYAYTTAKGKRKHMSDRQIKEFLFLESHYQDENGDWIER